MEHLVSYTGCSHVFWIGLNGWLTAGWQVTLWLTLLAGRFTIRRADD